MEFIYLNDKHHISTIINIFKWRCVWMSWFRAILGLLLFSILVSGVSAVTSVSNTPNDNKMMIWDDTNDILGENMGHYPGDAGLGFYANYTTIAGVSINGTGVYCQIKDNVAGWNNKANLTFDSTRKLYYIDRAVSPAGVYYFNVLCNGISKGHGILNTTDDFFISVLGAPAYHGEHPIPTDRFINLRPFNVTDPIVYHGVSRAYYQKVLRAPSGVYYMYYSDVNTTGITVTAVANSSDGDHFKFVRYSIHSGHPLVTYSADGFGINNKYIYYIWDEVSPGHSSPYKKSIRAYYGNNSDLTGMKDMGYVNFTWMIGNSNNGTISGTYGLNNVFYNASGNGGTSKNPFDYKFAAYFDCAGGSAENLCVVGSDDPLKFTKTSLHKVLMNDTPGAWDNLKLGYGDVQRYKGYYIAIYEGGKTSTREGTGLAYLANGSGRFTRLSSNPILKKDAVYLNKSVGGASLLIEGLKARLYVAGINNTGSMYQVVQYLFDIRRDRNFTLTTFVNNTVIVFNMSNGVLYNFKSGIYGDRVSLLEGKRYNIKVQADGEYVVVNGINASKTNATNIMVHFHNMNVTLPGTVQSSSVICSNASGFNSTTIYFHKTVVPTKVCYCATWNMDTLMCPGGWSCTNISNYHSKSNSTYVWINVTHFSAYVLGEEAPYSAPNVTSVVVSSTNVLQGQNVSVVIGVNMGKNDLSKVSFNYNNTLGGIASAVSGNNSLIFVTVGKRGNYSISGYVNDSNNTIRGRIGPNVNIYTTTTTSTSSTTSTSTTTTTTTSTTTTTIYGSLKISVSNSSGTEYGATISIIRSNGSVLINKNLTVLAPSVNTSILHNANNYIVNIHFNNNDSVKILNYDFNTINKSIVFQTRNFSGDKPVSLRTIESNVIASNFSNGKTVLSFKTNTLPTKVCKCDDWGLIYLSCLGSWKCGAASDYEYKFNGSVFSFNVTHFSAYVLGGGEFLKIWDDTNDIQGQDIKHYSNRMFGFYANYSNTSSHVISPAMNGYCTFREDSSGYFSAGVNMSYNSTSKLYYIYKNISANSAAYLYNITCGDSSDFYDRLSAVDDYVVSARTILLNSLRWSEVYWWSAEVVAHSLTYGVVNSTLACDYLNLYYVETPPLNGIEKKINASADVFGHNCQNATQGAFTIHNDGTVGIDVSAKFDHITSGVTMKTGHSSNGWKPLCNGSCDGISCNLISNCLRVNVSSVKIAYNMPQNTSKQYWLWADFNGVAGTFAPTKGNMTTNATKSNN
jgi:hypothetical protein